MQQIEIEKEMNRNRNKWHIHMNIACSSNIWHKSEWTGRSNQFFLEAIHIFIASFLWIPFFSHFYRLSSVNPTFFTFLSPLFCESNFFHILSPFFCEFHFFHIFLAFPPFNFYFVNLLRAPTKVLFIIILKFSSCYDYDNQTKRSTF